MGDKVSLALPANLDSLLLHEIDARLSHSTGALHFQIMVANGEAGWSAAMFSETVFARVKLQVKVLDQDTGGLLLEKSAESWGQNRDLDADDEDLPKVFQRVFMDAFVRFLDLEANQSAINDAMSHRQSGSE